MARDFDSSSEPELFHGVEQFLGSPAFERMIKDEFPEDAAEWLDPVTRRQFVTLLGASAALAGAVGCNPSVKPASQRQVLPYVKKPEGLEPNVPLFFATTFPHGGYGTGVLVKSTEGRPVKVEGNPSHPASLGSTDVFAQASVLGLYDPDRSKQITERGVATAWDKAKAKLVELIDAQVPKRGAGLRVLTETVTSPTLAALLAEMKARLPDMKWVQYEPAGRENVVRGAKLAFGRHASPVYNFADADVILSVDSDYLAVSGPGGVKYTRDTMGRRKLRVSHDRKSGAKPDGVKLDRLSRIYAVESTVTNTGAVADHRLPVKPSEVESVVREIAKAVGVAGAPAAGSLSAAARKFVEFAVKDLQAAKGNAAVIAGESLSAVGHALVFAVNQKLGAVGKTLTFVEPAVAGMAGPDADAVADGTASLKALVEDMNKGAVEALFVLGGNPAFAAPADLKFADALAKVKTKVHLGLYQDDTAALCDWHVNEAHYLETWGDARAFDGTASVMQPLIAPLHGGKSAVELLAVLLNKELRDPLLLVKATWQRFHADNKVAGGFDGFWHTTVERGVVANSAAAKVDVGEPKLADEVTKAVAPATVKDDIEIAFRCDPTLGDGRYANNAWLQELPKPISRIAWDNAALVSPATADRLGVGPDYNGFFVGPFSLTAGEHGRYEAHMVTVAVGDQKVNVPVFPIPGHPDDVITLHFGGGKRRGVSEPMKAVGADVYPLRTAANPWSVGGIKPGQSAVRTGGKYILACTQGQHAMEGRRPARSGTAGYLRARDKDSSVSPIDAFNDHQIHSFKFANDPPAAAAEKELIQANVPGTPEERERLANTPEFRDKGYTNNIHKHDDEGDRKKEGERHHEHDARLVPLSLVSDFEKNKLYRRWAMAIDLGACTGCTACVAACVAENNIPVVGKTEVTRGRIMHWIRVDRYFAAPSEDRGRNKVAAADRWEELKRGTADVTTHFQPLPCQQCEKAPCELVCPVNATVHSADGLNDMVYNRCVGTRYCANNCPYKVRRFNFVQYANYANDTITLVNNPEVTVRSRGVMEKCTYCVQRIRNAEIEAEREHDNSDRVKVKTPLGVRPLIKDGEIKTACQQACPAGAISFGDLNYDQYVPVNPDGSDGRRLGFSEVGRWKLEPTHYGLLAELNTMPRTSYLAAVKNPNDELVKALDALKGA